MSIECVHCHAIKHKVKNHSADNIGLQTPTSSQDIVILLTIDKEHISPSLMCGLS